MRVLPRERHGCIRSILSCEFEVCGVTLDGADKSERIRGLLDDHRDVGVELDQGRRRFLSLLSSSSTHTWIFAKAR